MIDDDFVVCGRLLGEWIQQNGFTSRRLAAEIKVSDRDMLGALVGSPQALLNVMVCLAAAYPSEARSIVRACRVSPVGTCFIDSRY